MRCCSRRYSSTFAIADDLIVRGPNSFIANNGRHLLTIEIAGLIAAVDDRAEAVLRVEGRGDAARVEGAGNAAVVGTCDVVLVVVVALALNVADASPIEGSHQVVLVALGVVCCARLQVVLRHCGVSGHRG